jgi:magnesium-transporting ATPase (P-type)
MLKRIITSALITLGLLSPIALGVVVASPNAYADNKTSVCEGIAATGGSCATTDEEKSAQKSKVNKTISNIINLLSWVVGVVSVIVIIIGGLLYVTSAGDPQKATKARQAILYAIVGLVIVAFAQLIVQFVIGTLG